MIIAIIIGAVAVVGIIIALVAYSSKVSNEDMRERKSGADSFRSLNEDETKILAKGRENLLSLRTLVMRITNAEIKQKATDIGTVIEKILKELKDKPEKIPSVRQFLNYYLPTLGKVLETYEHLEKNEVPGDEMTDKVSAYLSNVKDAMDRQYANLFTADAIDMSVEMEAMTMAVKGEGLLQEVMSAPEKEKEPLKLVL